MNISKTHTTNASIKWFILTIAIISIALLSYPAKAETGSITVSNETNANWTRPEAFSNYVIIQTDKLENFSFDTGNFTSFVNYTIFDPYHELTYAEPNEVTTFQITTNGSGHGVASYSRFLNQLNWVCGGDCVITGQFFKVTYDKNIFQNVTSSGAPGTNGWDFAAALTGAPPPANNTNNTMPMYVYNGSVAGANFANRSLVGFDKAPNTRRLIFSGIFNSGTVTNTYNITYPAQGFYLATISKAGQTIKTKDFLHTQTNNSQGYYSEADLNNNSFQVLMPQLDGIYLNVTMGTGDFNDVLINASGSTVVVPANNGSAGTNIATCTKPNSGANICFDKTSYFVGDNINVSWYLSDDVQNNFYSKKIELYLNNEFITNINIASQTGFYIYQSTIPGTFRADVKQGILSFDTIGTGSVLISAPENSWIALSNTTIYAKTPMNVTYHIGFSVTNYPASALEIDINDISNGDLVDSVFPATFPNGNIMFGVVHPIPVGNYSVRLIDFSKNLVLDTKYFTAIPSPIPFPALNITTSSITADKTLYFYNDWAQFNYLVDDVNFSNYNYTVMAHVIALDRGNITTKMFITPFTEQVGTFTSVINIDKNTKCDKGLNCWFEAGNNSINLVLMNSTASVTLAYANFTVSSTTVDGYGLQLSTTTPTTGVTFTATITVPASHRGTLRIKDSGYGNNFELFNTTINNTGLTSYIQTIPLVINRVNINQVGYYDVSLYGDDGFVKVTIPITVSGAPQAPKTQSEQNTINMFDFWVSLMGLGVNPITRFLFAWIVTSLFILGGYLTGGKESRGFGAGALLGTGSWGIFTIVGFLPTWFVIIIVLELVALLKLFR